MFSRHFCRNIISCFSVSLQQDYQCMTYCPSCSFKKPPNPFRGIINLDKVDDIIIMFSKQLERHITFLFIYVLHIKPQVKFIIRITL